MNQLENWLAVYFGEKAPQLPPKAKEVIVKIAPWLVLVGVLLSLPAIFSLLGWGAALGSWMMWGGVMGGTYYLWLILTIAVIVLEIIALPGLFHRTRKGWLFAFYAVLVSAIQNLVMMSIGGLVIGLLIGLYLLFQVRSYYHSASTSAV